MIFHLSWTAGSITLADSSKYWMDLLWVFYDLHNTQTIGSAQKCLFWTLYIILKVLISRKLYIILNWLTFQNDQKTCLSISANKIYIKNQRKWPKMRISILLLLNEIFRISSETWFTVTCMQIENNQRKINFHYVRANFRKNLDLTVFLHMVQFLALH